MSCRAEGQRDATLITMLHSSLKHAALQLRFSSADASELLGCSVDMLAAARSGQASAAVATLCEWLPAFRSRLLVRSVTKASVTLVLAGHALCDALAECGLSHR